VTFREGLLKARGQLAFVTALVLSTGFIIYLETLDTEARIQNRAAELARQANGAPAVSEPLRAAVAATLRRARDAFERDPAAAANRAAILTSVASAVQLGVMASSEGLAQAQKVLDGLERNPGEQNPNLASALAAIAATFPSLQDRIGRLMPAS
jgi:hypothetical protein